MVRVPFGAKNQAILLDDLFFGTPEGTRTPDLLIRSQSLYPTELPAHTFAERLDIVAQGGWFVKFFFGFRGIIFSFALFQEKSPPGPGVG